MPIFEHSNTYTRYEYRVTSAYIRKKLKEDISNPNAIPRGKEKGLPPTNYYQACCQFCKYKMTSMFEKTGDGCMWDACTNFEFLLLCPKCGWWIFGEKYYIKMTGVLDQDAENHYETVLHHSSLIDLDLSDISLPLDEVRRFLIAKFEARNNLHPRLFEEVVADVFSSLGYDASTTSYHSDGGIDVILQGKGEERIGVQVKRYKNAIGVEQIRSFIGAMVIEGYAHGVFVTTSRFTRGAKSLPTKVKSLNIPSISKIDLVDGNRFFREMQISTLTPYRSISEWKSLNRLKHTGKIINVTCEMNSWA